ARPAGRATSAEKESGMFPAKFAYAAPSSLQEAVGLLEDPDAKILAGGHSLLPLMKLRLAQAKPLGHIKPIAGRAKAAGRHQPHRRPVVRARRERPTGDRGDDHLPRPGAFGCCGEKCAG